MRAARTFALAALLVATPLAAPFAAPVAAQAQDAAEFDIPQAALVLTIRAELSPGTDEGVGPDGARTQIPITGGRFEGQSTDGAPIAGDVLPGGADWQLQRADGAREVVARYLIRTDDGATIQVENIGLIVAGPEGAYFRAAPRFIAPVGPYDWLNKALFVSTVTAPPPGQPLDHVVVRVFKIE